MDIKDKKIFVSGFVMHHPNPHIALAQRVSLTALLRNCGFAVCLPVEIGSAAGVALPFLQQVCERNRAEIVSSDFLIADVTDPASMWQGVETARCANVPVIAVCPRPVQVSPMLLGNPALAIFIRFRDWAWLLRRIEQYLALWLYEGRCRAE